MRIFRKMLTPTGTSEVSTRAVYQCLRGPLPRYVRYGGAYFVSSKEVSAEEVGPRLIPWLI